MASERHRERDRGEFVLPPGVTCERKAFTHGQGYEFRHKRLGQLGRLVLRDVGGQCHASAEVAGDPNDPMTQKRREILEPITMGLINRLVEHGGAAGPGVRYDQPRPTPSDGGEWVESQLVMCERCNAKVAHIVFADNAQGVAGLEDYARKMYKNIARLRLPTWIVGPQLGGGPPEQRPSDVLKAWPEREPVRRLTPAEFHAEVDAVVDAHCE